MHVHTCCTSIRPRVRTLAGCSAGAHLVPGSTAASAHGSTATRELLQYGKNQWGEKVRHGSEGLVGSLLKMSCATAIDRDCGNYSRMDVFFVVCKPEALLLASCKNRMYSVRSKHGYVIVV